jgi:hypothetical protein
VREYPRRWLSTSFGAWVSRVQVRPLLTQLHTRGFPVTSHAAYDWLSGRRLPTWDCAKAIVEISGGELSVFDVMDHRTRLASMSNARRSPMEPLPEPSANVATAGEMRTR